MTEKFSGVGPPTTVARHHEGGKRLLHKVTNLNHICLHVHDPTNTRTES